MRIVSATSLALLAILIPTAGASAARVPPGNSAATQYSETVPGAGGEEGAPEAGGGSSRSSSNEGGTGRKSAVPSKTAREFEELGSEGEAVLKLAGGGEPSSSAHGKGGKNGKKGHGGKGGKHEGAVEGGATVPSDPGGPDGSSLASAKSNGSSGVGKVLGGAVGTSGGGLGFLQPLILIAIVAAAVAYVLRRRANRPA